jgi:ABC-type glycerol-3-phosphate transport system substrate-binding protein
MNFTTFQLFFMAGLIVIIVAGVMIFALRGGVGGASSVGKVTVWGTVDQTVMDQVLGDLRGADKNFNDTVYVKKDPKNFTSELINAMASGKSPDLFIMPQDQLLAFSNKILTVPFGAMSQQTYVDSFIDEGQLFLSAAGIRAFPFMVDPLVMYWNRDSFAEAGLPRPPQYWSDLLDITPKLSVVSGGSNVDKSAIAMGEWDNVQYAKDILAMLFIQAGDPIIKVGDEVTKYQVTLGSNPADAQEAPAISALRFYTEFSNPAKTSYTWNKTMPTSQDAFVAGDVALYLGYSSDFPTLLERNPNLNFGVAVMPQVKGNSSRVTFGRMIGLAIPRTSSNPTGAMTIAIGLSGQTGIASLSSHSTLPPVRRDVTVDTSKNAAASIFIQSSLISRSWLDPDPTKTDGIFNDMVQSVLSGKNQPQEAISNAGQIMQSIVYKL